MKPHVAGLAMVLSLSSCTLAVPAIGSLSAQASNASPELRRDNLRAAAEGRPMTGYQLNVQASFAAGLAMDLAVIALLLATDANLYP